MKKTGKHKNKTKKNKSIICRSIKAPCPLCNDILSGDLIFLIKHFKNIHARMPTLGEANRFRAFTKKDSRKSNYTISFFKDRREISGGLPSLGKKK